MGSVPTVWTNLNLEEETLKNNAASKFDLITPFVLTHELDLLNGILNIDVTNGCVCHFVQDEKVSELAVDAF